MKIQIDPSKSALIWKELADQQIPFAVYAFVNLLYFIKGIAKDKACASFPVSHAADLGDVHAQLLYEVFLHSGVSCGASLEFGARYLRIAAEAGTTQAQREYDMCLLKGESVEQNGEADCRYLQIAATAGDRRTKRIWTSSPLWCGC